MRRVFMTAVALTLVLGGVAAVSSWAADEPMTKTQGDAILDELRQIKKLGERLVVFEVVGEKAELLHLDEIHQAERLALTDGLEGERLEARAAFVGTLGDEDEVQLGPVAAHHVEERASAALVLDGDELPGRWPVLHLDEVFVLLAGIQPLRDAKVRREVLAAEAQGRRLLAPERRHVVPRAPKDRLDQGFG